MNTFNTILNFTSRWIEPATMLRVIPYFLAATVVLLLLREGVIGGIIRAGRIARWTWHFFWYGAFINIHTKEPTQPAVTGKALVGDSGTPLDVPIEQQQDVAQVPVHHGVHYMKLPEPCLVGVGEHCSDLFCMKHLDADRARLLHDIHAQRIAHLLTVGRN